MTQVLNLKKKTDICGEETLGHYWRRPICGKSWQRPMALQPVTLTCRTHSGGHKPKITGFCTQCHFNWHQEMAKVTCVSFWHCSNTSTPFYRGQPDQRSYFQHQLQTLYFTSILSSCFQFLLFTLIFIPKTIQHAQQRYVRRMQRTQ